MSIWEQQELWFWLGLWSWKRAIIYHKVSVRNLEEGPKKISCYVVKHQGGEDKGRITNWRNHGIRVGGGNTKIWIWLANSDIWTQFSRSPVTRLLAQSIGSFLSSSQMSMLGLLIPWISWECVGNGGMMQHGERVLSVNSAVRSWWGQSWKL